MPRRPPSTSPLGSSRESSGHAGDGASPASERSHESAAVGGEGVRADHGERRSLLPRPAGAREGRLPVEARERATHARRARADDVSRRFLVVDHSIVTQRIIARALENHGHQAVLAGAGADALVILRGSSAAFDHVLVDLKLRDLDALAVIREVRRLAGDRTRISALSTAVRGTGPADRDLERSVEAGADGLLLKPLRGRDLQGLVHMGDAAAGA